MQGGVGDCTSEIAKGLAGLGVEPHVLTTADRSASAESGAKSSPNICEPDIHVLRLVRNWNWSSLRLVTSAARQLAPEIVHIQYQTGAFGMHPAINFLPRYLRTRGWDVGRATRPSVIPRPRTITTYHDLRNPYLFPKAGPVRRWVNQVLARSSDGVIATDEQDYMRLKSSGVKNLDLIPIGSNIPLAPPGGYRREVWRANLDIGQDVTLLSYFGFLNESKGGETLIRALAQVSGANLLMIGGQVGASDPTNRTYLARVQTLIKELGLGSRVLWTGFTPADEVSANLLASDICVLPYRDGASFRRGSLMAALAHGLPIVTTFADFPPSSPVPPSPELESGIMNSAALPRLRDGENVLLVPPDDPGALGEAISRLVSLPELRARLSHGAFELAQHFTWNKIAERHLKLYRLVLGFPTQGSGPGSIGP
jgi:glycosyltransferase involved in cell wall biosynthesis